jgi:hypothetical protein
MKRVAVVAAATLVAIVLGAPSSARYATVAPGLVQWEWAVVDDPSAVQVTDVAVRDDGWLIVATAADLDGRLHLVAPWGGRIGAATRFGPTALGFRHLEFAGSRLFGMRQETLRPDTEQHAPGELFELDPRTGEIVADLGGWWHDALAVDPPTGHLLVREFGGDDPAHGHGLVRLDPDTGATVALVADADPSSDDSWEVAVSADGARIFTAHTTGSTIDVRDRAGAVIHSLNAGQVDALVAAAPGTCFEGRVLFTRSDGSAWSVATTPGASAQPVAAGGRPATVSRAALDRNGNLLSVRLADATLVACPPFAIPQAPAGAPPASVAPRARIDAAPRAEAAPAAVAAPPAPAPAAAPPPPPPPPPPAAPPAPPVPLAAPMGGAMQSAAAPSVGIADVPDEEHVTSLAASAGPTLVLLVGAALAMAMIAYALGAARDDFVAEAHVRGER